MIKVTAPYQANPSKSASFQPVQRDDHIRTATNNVQKIATMSNPVVCDTRPGSDGVAGNNPETARDPAIKKMIYNITNIKMRNKRPKKNFAFMLVLF
jgi:hypothetical protein